MAMALALVPPEDVKETLQMLFEELPEDVPLEEFMAYMRSTYVGRYYPENGGRRRSGLGPIVPTYPIFFVEPIPGCAPRRIENEKL